MRRTLAFAAIASLLGNPLCADEPKEINPIKLTIHARAIETPILKYRLLPTETELKPGNAAPILLRIAWEQTKKMSDFNRDLGADWENRPRNAPEWKDYSGLRESLYNEIKRAAFRREATWEYPIGETRSSYQILLEDLQNLRHFLVYGLSSKIRYHLARGELDKAREGIVVGLANGRHLSRTPFYINQLVARSVERAMLDRTGELIEKPGSPNLYWALSTLPDSLLSFDRAASLQSSLFAMELPAVNDLDRPRDAKEWRKMATQLVDWFDYIGALPKQLAAPKSDGSLVGQFLQHLDSVGKSPLAGFVVQARAELPGLLKFSEQTVAAMSDDEACIRWYVHTRLSHDHNLAAVLGLPPREAWPRLQKLQAEIKAKQKFSGEEIFEGGQPGPLYIAAWSLKRNINALRIVEAVRHHLATHDGKLPASLDDITDTPIPLDPLTDRPFEWTVAGKTATLKAPPLPIGILEPGSAREKANMLEYRLEVK